MTDIIKEHIDSGIIAVCDKCEQMWPTIIHTCKGCHQEVAKSRGYHSNIQLWPVFWCFDCSQKLEDKAWKYEDLQK